MFQSFVMETPRKILKVQGDAGIDKVDGNYHASLLIQHSSLQWRNGQKQQNSKRNDEKREKARASREFQL